MIDIFKSVFYVCSVLNIITLVNIDLSGVYVPMDTLNNFTFNDTKKPLWYGKIFTYPMRLSIEMISISS